MSQPLALSPTLHGAGCALGELLLSESEVQKVNAAILGAGFRFGEVSSSPSTNERTPPPPSATTQPAVKSEPSRPRRQASAGKRKAPPPKSAAASVEVPTTEQQPAAKKKRTADSSYRPPPAPTSPAPVDVPSLPPPRQEEYLPITEPLTVPPRKGPIVIESADAFWVDAASQVLAKLEAHPMSVSFMSPVNPAAEGLEDYFEKVKTPIDLQTIRQKLEGNMYSHPFRWQLDVRTIFFNAFTYHPEGSPVRRAAHELAVHFENLLKQEDMVNPYVVFKRPAKVKPRPPTPPVIEPASEVTTAPVAPPLPAPQSASQSPALSPQIAPVSAGEKITMDAAQLQALLVKAAASGVPSIAPTPTGSPNLPPLAGSVVTPSPQAPSQPAAPSASESRVGTGGARGARGKNKGGRERELPPGVTTKEGLGIIYTPDCANTRLGMELSANEPYSALPAPCLVPPTDNKNLPPMLSVGQKRTALARFKELDVTYRKAVLDLVKDELGIHSSLCAQDLRYTPDVDVLPPIKQRQFFLYLKALVNQQKQAQDELHLPATLPRVLNWNMGAEQPAPPPPVEEEVPLPTSPPEPRLDRGSPDTLPWGHHRLPSPGTSSSDSLGGGPGGGRGVSSSSSDEEGSSSDSDESDSELDTPTPSTMKPSASSHPAASGAPFGRLGGAPPPPPSTTPLRTGAFVPTAPGPYMATAAPMGRAPAMARPPTGYPGVFTQTRMSFPYVPTVPAVGLGKQRPKLDLDPRSPAVPGLGFWRGSGVPVGMAAAGPVGKPTSPPNPWGMPENTPSCWGEWKAKVIQEKFLSQHRNVGVASERESRAERADAEI